ncbi:MAG: MmgE/PrpD family protein [Alphaproteobacteria bacterium]|nr:MmgE/PrpD family protein [Alphaproteobacteria bacterium]
MDDAGTISTNAPPTTAGTLAGWIAGTGYADLPADVVAYARLCILDSLACMIGGMRLEPSRVLLDVLGGTAAGAPVSVPGTAARIGLLGAAYLGAQAANALDFDDSFRSGAPSHPGATVVPPGLALAEARDAGGAAFLAAVVVGYEVSLRIGRAVQPSPARKAAVMGFSPWQSFGAAAAAASLLALPAEVVRSVLGLAGAQAPVPSVRKFVDGVRPYSWIKNAYGIAAEAGVLSALLAERGFLGNREIFDGPNGFWVMCGSDQYRPELATEGLGGRWLILDVGFKPYACCRWTHTMIDALRALAPAIGDRPVARVDVYGFRELTRSLAGDPPDSIIEAQFNAPWVAALELAGRSAERGLADADLADPRVLDLARKVHLHHDEAMDGPYFEKGTLPVRVAVTLADGSTVAGEADKPSGSVEAGGFSEAAMTRKFLQVVGPVLGEERARRALSIVATLEGHSARELVASLVP